jgi:hypothetical protein
MSMPHSWLEGGKYDDAATAARDIAGGNVLLIVIDGRRGHGFQTQIVNPRVLATLPDVLEDVAKNIRKQLTAGGN